MNAICKRNIKVTSVIRITRGLASKLLNDFAIAARSRCIHVFVTVREGDPKEVREGDNSRHALEESRLVPVRKVRR
jgi:hypothetical protein